MKFKGKLMDQTLENEGVLTEIDIERTHRVGKPKQNKKNPRPIIIKFVRYNCRQSIFLNEKNLKAPEYLSQKV